MAIATTLVAGVSVDAGDDGDRLYGPRADAVSRLAPDGGIFRVGADICLVDRGLLVSRTGSDWRTQKRATAQGCATSLEHWPSLRLRQSTFWVAGLFIGLTVLGLLRLGVQDDVRLLQNPPKSLIDDQIKLSRLLDAPTPTQFYIVRGKTAEVVLQREEMLSGSIR